MASVAQAASIVKVPKRLADKQEKTVDRITMVPLSSAHTQRNTPESLPAFVFPVRHPLGCEVSNGACNRCRVPHSGRSPSHTRTTLPSYITAATTPLFTLTPRPPIAPWRGAPEGLQVGVQKRYYGNHTLQRKKKSLCLKK